MKAIPLINSFSAAVAAVCLILVSCQQDKKQEVEVAAPAGVSRGDVVYVASNDESLDTFVSLLQSADLVGMLQGPGPYTVFAPTDEAFDKLPDGMVDDLIKPANREQLRNILLHHVVPGRHTSLELVETDHVMTLQGERLTITTRDGNIFIDGATVVTADLRADNGLMHGIDRVIMPASSQGG